MTQQPNFTLSRRLAAAVAIFSGLVAFGGFGLGFSLPDGHYLALASLFAGVTLTGYLWWSMAQQPANTAGLNIMLLVTFVLVAGLALYSNVSYLLWALGFPMEIGTAKQGNMGEVYWLPPATLLYAVVGWISLKYYAAKQRRR